MSSVMDNVQLKKTGGKAKAATKKTPVVKKTAAPTKKATPVKKAAAPAKKATPAKKAAAPTKKITTSATTEPSLILYVNKVSKVYNNDVGVYKNVKEYLEQVLKYWVDVIAKTSTEQLKDRKTVQERDIRSAIEELIPENNLRQTILTNLDGRLEKYSADKKSVSLTMSKPRITTLFKTKLDNVKVSDKALFYLTAFLEDVVRETTMAANEFSKKKERSNIVLDDLRRGLKTNADLTLLTSSIEFPSK